MKTAFAVWNNRIAPVFDVARRVIMVESTAAGKDAQTPVVLAGDPPLQKVQQLSDLGVGRLVCGAISRGLEAVLTARGIQVTAYVAGDVQAVIDAWQRRHFEIESYAMPGRRKNRRRRSNRGPAKAMFTADRRGAAERCAGGRGRGGPRRCR
jgi:predicted Fe-Mo cluster-binding NifX family protein